MIKIQNIFLQIKQSISITDTFSFYGVKIERRSGKKLFASCPFHSEKTASLAIYPESNSFNCFGCGIGGDIFTFTGRLFGLSPLDAARKLDDDFRLGLTHAELSPENKRRIAGEAAERQRDKQLLQGFEYWVNNAYIRLCEYLHILQDFKEKCQPAETPDTADIRYIEALHNIDYIEWLIDSLFFAELDDQIQFYKAYRKEVRVIADRIALHRQNRETQTA